ncbi:uncharacterized protein LOC107303424 [Oryza brachyantha]|uniref:uncharacterized protein LOC107303424 n=1 Tax=Oryza brachyantha TaxID=4533 RepID=UPI0007765441|nr:uncharacterized protein LOC107303424 [Oryza brachyantha]
MRNNARLQELGIYALSSIFANRSAIALDHNKATHRNAEESESEYEPSRDDTSEEDLIADDNTKQLCKEKSSKKTNNQTSDLPTGGVKFRSRKRVYAQQPSRVTTSKKSVTQPDANLTPSSILVPSLVQPDASLTPIDIRGVFEDNDLALHNDNIHMSWLASHTSAGGIRRSKTPCRIRQIIRN